MQIQFIQTRRRHYRRHRKSAKMMDDGMTLDLDGRKRTKGDSGSINEKRNETQSTEFLIIPNPDLGNLPDRIRSLGKIQVRESPEVRLLTKTIYI